MPVVRMPYDRERLSFQTTGESLTHQSMQDECDINQIMLKWQKTGIIEHTNTYEGRYGDFTETPIDYQEALNQVREAEDMFMSLPSSIRRQFENNPQEFLEFVGDPKNAEKLVDMGLAHGREEDVLEAPKTAPKEPENPPEEG